MSELQFFAVTAAGARQLAVPPDATDFPALYAGVELGVYTVLRTYAHNHFLHLEAHLARLLQSMQWLKWDYPLDEASLRQALDAVCTAYPAPEVRVRIDVLAAPALALGVNSRVLVALMPFVPLPASYYSAGVAVGFASDIRRSEPLVKMASFVATRTKAQAGTTFYEQLMVNEQGEILEGLSSNFYGVRQGVLYTAATGVLSGVTRSIMLKVAAENQISVELTPIRYDQIDQLDEAMLSSSSRGLLPVNSIAGQLIGDGLPGPLTRRLLAAYGDYVAGHIRRAIE